MDLLKSENESISQEIKVLENSNTTKNNQYYQVDSKNRWEIKLLEDRINRETKEINEKAKSISERLWNMVGFEDEKVR